MLTNKENILNFYNHKPMDRFVTWGDCAQYMVDSDFYHERPANMKDGKDWFGVEWIWDPALTYCPNANQSPVLPDITQWREVIQWPNLDSLDWENAVKVDHIEDRFDRTNYAFIIWLQNGPFERLHELMGFENCLMALLEEPDEVKAYLDRWIEYRCKLIDYICKYYKPDVLQVSDDSGTQLAPFYSVAVWEELFHPYWDKMAEQIRKNGVIPELHSCGYSQQLFNRVGNSVYDTMLIQKLNDFDEIQKHAGRAIGFIPSDYCTDLIVKAGSGGICVKEIKKNVDNYIRHSIDTLGHNFLMMVSPIPMLPDGDFADDYIVTSELEVIACVNTHCKNMASTYSEWLLAKK